MREIELKESEKNLILSMFENGESVSAISRVLPYSYSKTRFKVNCMVESGELEPQPNRVWGGTKRAVLLAYESGEHNPNAIAENVGCGVNTVRAILTANYKDRKRPSKNYNKTKLHKISDLSEKTQEIMGEILQGKRTSEIMARHGVTRQYVSLLRKKLEKGVVEIG